MQNIKILPKKPATLIESLQLLLRNTKEEKQNNKVFHRSGGFDIFVYT
jgi:hypothetical protein